jgi:hypothetical protein
MKSKQLAIKICTSCATSLLKRLVLSCQVSTHILSQNQTNQKLYSNYYRVAFYGPKFDEFNETEWVYKESSAVRLSDISDRLKVTA